MITIQEFLDKMTEIWPYATKQEKEDFCNALCGPGGAIAAYSAYKQLLDTVTKRRGGSQ